MGKGSGKSQAQLDARSRSMNPQEPRSSTESYEYCIQVIARATNREHRELFGAKQGIGAFGPASGGEPSRGQSRPNLKSWVPNSRLSCTWDSSRPSMLV